MAFTLPAESGIVLFRIPMPPPGRVGKALSGILGEPGRTGAATSRSSNRARCSCLRLRIEGVPDVEHRNGVRKALERELAHRLERDEVLDLRERLAVGQDLRRFGLPAKARGEVRDAADRAVVQRPSKPIAPMVA